MNAPRVLRRGPPCFCRRTVLATYAVALLATGLPARSAEPPADLSTLRDLPIEEIMQIKIPTVYGASKHEQKVTDAPSSVSIVPREEVQAYGHRTLAEILRSVRDFYVTYDRNYGYVGVRGFNRPGDFGGRILLLIDGQRVNDPIYSNIGVVTDFAVDVDMIERVEVIRGPGSSLYGNNAFFAVINVVTRTARNVDGAEVSAEAGSLETFKGRLTFGHTFKNGLAILLTGTVFDSAGNERLFYKEYDQPETNGGIAEHLDADRSKSAGATISYNDFTLQTLYSQRRKEVPTGSYGTIFNDPDYYTLDENTFVRLSYAHDFEQDLSVRADVSWRSYYYSGDYPYALDATQPRDATILRDLLDAQWWRGELQVSKQLWRTHHLTAGAEFQLNTRLKVGNYYPALMGDDVRLEPTTSTYGFFLQDEWAMTKQLEVNAGARFDILDGFGSTLNPRGAVIYHPWKETALKLLYGRAFRAPNVYEASSSGYGYRPNSGLQPESIHSYEAVAEQALSASWRVSASVFYNDVKNLISEGVDSATGDLFFDNVESAETKGGSLELEARLPRGIKSRVGYTFQNSTDDATGARLSNSPQHLAKLNLLVPIYGEKLSSGLELQYSSAVENARGSVTSGYVLTNWTLLSRNVVKGLEVSASVYNLFDVKYSFPGNPEHLQDAIQQNGRTFRLKLTHHF